MKNLLLVVLVAVFCSACATLPRKRSSVNAVTKTMVSSVSPCPCPCMVVYPSTPGRKAGRKAKPSMKEVLGKADALIDEEASILGKNSDEVKAHKALAEADALISEAREADKLVRTTLPKDIPVNDSYGKYLDKMVDDTIEKSKPAKSWKTRLKERRK